MAIQDELKKHLEKGEAWEKMETNVPGVNVVKVPETKTRPALLFLELNPLTDDGRPMKRKGLFVNGYDMLIKFRDIIDNDKVFKLMQEIETVNPEITKKTKKLEIK